MAVLSKDDFFERIKNSVGDDSSDESISFIEDMSDTYNDMERRINEGDGIDWEQKYKENDAAWKKRYTNRFFNGSTQYNEQKDVDDEKEQYDPNSITFNDLFNGGKK